MNRRFCCLFVFVGMHIFHCPNGSRVLWWHLNKELLPIRNNVSVGSYMFDLFFLCLFCVRRAHIGFTINAKVYFFVYLTSFINILFLMVVLVITILMSSAYVRITAELLLENTSSLMQAALMDLSRTPLKSSSDSPSPSCEPPPIQSVSVVCLPTLSLASEFSIHILLRLMILLTHSLIIPEIISFKWD